MHDINFIISIFVNIFMVLFEGIKSQIHLGSFALIIRIMRFPLLFTEVTIKINLFR